MSAMARVAPTPIVEASPNRRATGRVTPRNGQLQLDKLAARVSVPSLCLNAQAGRMPVSSPVQPSALHGITPT